MGEYTKIGWADSTWNPWIGCTHAGPGCDHCYAEAQNKFRKWNGGTWGNRAPRQVSSKQAWRDPLSWEAKARAGRVGKDGHHWLVFAGDLCDIFDELGDKDARQRMWELFRETPHLTWLILTKRPEHISKHLPADWGAGYPNVWLGTTVENRKNGYPRMEALRHIPAMLRFISCEPLLENLPDLDLTGIDWAIAGGESGPQARPFDIEWARTIRRQCEDTSTTFFFKQLGGTPRRGGKMYELPAKKSNGRRDSHGAVLENFPPDLRIQKWPNTTRTRDLQSLGGTSALNSRSEPDCVQPVAARNVDPVTKLKKHQASAPSSKLLQRFAKNYGLESQIDDYAGVIDGVRCVSPLIRFSNGAIDDHAVIVDPNNDPLLIDIWGSKAALTRALKKSRIKDPLMLTLFFERKNSLYESIGFDVPSYYNGSGDPEKSTSSNWGRILHRVGLRYFDGEDMSISFLFPSRDRASAVLALALAGSFEAGESDDSEESGFSFVLGRDEAAEN
jgi:protein gp37